MSSIPTEEEAVAAARQAGLRHVDTAEPGFGRARRGAGFVYRDTEGRRITDPATLERIRRIVIPPAWTDVWISPVERGHIQATGRDSRGRKVYRYHERWRAVRDADKYAHLTVFAAALPRIRRRVARDLGRPGVCRERVAAATVRLLESTLIRIGNEEYAKVNRHYGRTTLRAAHVRARGRTCVSSSGERAESTTPSGSPTAGWRAWCAAARTFPVSGCSSTSTARARCTPSPPTTSTTTSARPAGSTSPPRTSAPGRARSSASGELRRIGPAESATGAERNVVAAVDEVARQLGNTRAVCRRCYVHPAVIDAYLDGSLLPALEDGGSDRSGGRGLRAEEAAVLALLRRRQRAERSRRRVA